jgi:serine/threonine protein kinase
MATARSTASPSNVVSSPRSPKRAEPGVVIGGYELVRRIGRGGMADVWVAGKPLGKKGTKFVAIKLIADHYVGDERYARMFRAEAELAAVLSHANIVQVFDEGEDDGRSYLIMEWVDGLNLLKLADMLALDEEQRRFRVIAYIIGQLLHALHYAHSITSADGNPLGVVHRDVSPQNVLVSNHGEVKLTDFGVAYRNFEESSGIHIKGKVRYMSPEQLSGKTRSPLVDLYALGAVMHELLDGKKFRGELEDGQDLLAVVLSGQVSPLSQPAPPELDHLRLGLLEPDPARRIQTAEHALVLLKCYPGYGDARDELTKLCGSLTGVLRPRSGPGPLADDRLTTGWGVRKPLAKPRLHISAERLRSVANLPPGATPHAGAPIAAQSSDDAGAVAAALITGQTLVQPHALLRPRAGGPPAGVSTSWQAGAARRSPKVLVAGMPARVRSDSETDLPAPPAIASEEGSETQSAVRADLLVSSHAGGTSMPPRAAAFVGLTLGLLLVMSVTAMLSMFTDGRNETSTTAWPHLEANATMERKAVEHHETSTVEQSQPRAARAVQPERESPHVEETAATRTETEVVPTREPVVWRVRTPRSGETRRSTAVSRKHKPPAPKVVVKVRGGVGLDRAEVRIGSQTVPVSDASQRMVTAGRKRLQWRSSDRDPWKPGGIWTFEAGTTLMIFVTKGGLKIRPIS